MQKNKHQKERSTRDLVLCIPPLLGIYRLTNEGLKQVRMLHGVEYAPQRKRK